MGFEKVKTTADHQVVGNDQIVQIASAGPTARHHVLFALVSRNTGGTGHVNLKFGTRVVLSSTSQGEAAAARDLVTNVGEAIEIELETGVTADYVVSWELIRS